MNWNRFWVMVSRGYELAAWALVVGLLGIIFGYGLFCYYAAWAEGFSVTGVSFIFFATCVTVSSGGYATAFSWIAIRKIRNGQLSDDPWIDWFAPFEEIVEFSDSVLPLVFAAIPAGIVLLWLGSIAFTWLSGLWFFDTLVTILAIIIGVPLFLVWFFCVPPLDHTDAINN